jgi:hypothetical protein
MKGMIGSDVARTVAMTNFFVASIKRSFYWRQRKPSQRSSILKFQVTIFDVNVMMTNSCKHCSFAEG